MKRNISIQYEMRNPLSEAEAILSLTVSDAKTNKKLRRLPHVFTRVLELPFRSDADVSVQELPNSFRFVVDTPPIQHVEAQTLQIHPGVTLTKVIANQTSFDELDLDVWRFRLPESTQPELATAALVGGDLIVTVPKAHDGDGVWRSENRGVDAAPTLVLVQ